MNTQTKPYHVIIKRTVRVAVRIESHSMASLRRDMKQCQENWDSGGNDELMDLHRQGIEQYIDEDTLKVVGVVPVKETN